MIKFNRGARSLALAASTGLASVLFAAQAVAHSFLVEATPSSKEHVASSPKTIKLRFGGGVEPPYSRISVENGDGKVLAEGAVGKPEAPRELTLDVPVLPPGKYVVKFRVLSQDGHIVPGSYEFTIDAK
jgi:copper resistance protein C